MPGPTTNAFDPFKIDTGLSNYYTAPSVHSGRTFVESLAQRARL